ncbi:MAG: cell division protein FtsZ [Nitrospirae bacterium]|nr:MAG: cell division protein FtsZ [Nitrospirota bacterium]
MTFEIEEVRRSGAIIKVVGVGGGGNNAISSMIRNGLEGVEFMAINTDLQCLENCLAPVKVQIGKELTRGLGAGSDPQIGREAAIQDQDLIAEHLKGADMVFITAGMGGGTGTGAAPVVASVAKEMGALVVAVVTKPFFYEGKKRKLNAEEGVKKLAEFVDSLIVIPNDRISMVVDKNTSLFDAFAKPNEVLMQAVQGITDLILVPGIINVDFADVRTIMSGSGKAVMGVGVATAEEGAREAARKAISNPLLEDSSIEGARGVLINITGGPGLSIEAAQEATALVYESAHDDANIIFGAVYDEKMEDTVRVTVIATNFEEKRQRRVVSEEMPFQRWRPKVIKPQEEEVTVEVQERHDEEETPVLSASSVSSEEDAVEEAKEKAPEVEEPLIVENDKNKDQVDSTPDEDFLVYEDIYDRPTFLRKSSFLSKRAFLGGRS